MGPGSFDPGSTLAAGSKIIALPGFNGAGVFRPRKSTASWKRSDIEQTLQWGRGLSTPEVSEGLAQRFLPLRFNGAGVFRPRKFDAPSPALRRRAASMGPGSFDPGSARPAKSGARDYEASMGPGSFDPGSSGTGARQVGVYGWLQWGRGLSTPEVKSLQKAGKNQQSFNGAGVFRPRKSAATTAAAATAARFNGAGVFRPRK